MKNSNSLRKPRFAGRLKAPDKRRKRIRGQTLIFTTAQNNTFVHDKFWKSLMHLADERGAKIVVGKSRYNKNGFQNATAENEDGLWWDTRLEPYFDTASMVVAPDLIWCGELDILPTAERPLSGFDGYSRNASSIIPHVKVQLKSVPRMRGEDPKFLLSTGTVTMRNYIQRKAGQKAEFHHVFGALLVEFNKRGRWFARQLIADEKGEFYDLDKKYTPEGFTSGHRVEALNYGDIHEEHEDAAVAEGAWYGAESMLAVLNPKHQFIHDLTDFARRNHHNVDDPYFMAEQRAKSQERVVEELHNSAGFLERIARPDTITVVVESNHDQALETWLRDPRGRTDPANARHWHEWNAHIHAEIEEGRHPFVYRHVVRGALTSYAKERTRFLREDESYEICKRGRDPGIECGMHGHRGANGARGSANGMRSFGKRTNRGHGHSPNVLDGDWTAGVMCKLDLRYAKGPSSWAHATIVTYPNSKRCMIVQRGKEWRA